MLFSAETSRKVPSSARIQPLKTAHDALRSFLYGCAVRARASPCVQVGFKSHTVPGPVQHPTSAGQGEALHRKLSQCIPASFCDPFPQPAYTHQTTHIERRSLTYGSRRAVCSSCTLYTFLTTTKASARMSCSGVPSYCPGDLTAIPDYACTACCAAAAVSHVTRAHTSMNEAHTVL